jgi:hypothetical protein
MKFCRFQLRVVAGGLFLRDLAEAELPVFCTMTENLRAVAIPNRNFGTGFAAARSAFRIAGISNTSRARRVE